MKQKELIISMLNYIDNNIYKQISMDELSKNFFYNKDYLMRIFKKELNITIIDYINIKRIYTSLNTLRNQDYTILKTALINGYSSQEYFSEMFKKIIGVSPLIYRKFTKVNTTIDKNSIFNIIVNQAYIKQKINYIDNYKNSLQKNNIIALKKY